MGNLQRVFVFLFITVLILTILLAKMTTFFDNVNYTRYLFASKETLPTSQWLMAESISTSLNNSNLTPSKIAALNPTKNGALRRQEDTVSRQTAAPTRYTAHTSPKAVTLESTKNVTLSSVSDGKKYLIYRCMGGIGFNKYFFFSLGFFISFHLFFFFSYSPFSFFLSFFLSSSSLSFFQQEKKFRM
ncbi:unnamed protein product [Acanthosepion pharaonis]|uniref:Uncharacterized protein n=1 Tax=Acanthosepion pharaonis TaxID=158019 RepID=A0A812CYG3_ACAPH|nr:unnamed protein product [Sepia pharaonis]